MKLFKYILITLSCLLLFYNTYAQENDTNQTSDFSDEIFDIVEEMPCFPGCEDKKSYKKQKKCADKKMLQFIEADLQYPAEAQARKIKGTVVVSFVIEKDGSTSNTKLLRDIGGGCGEEVLRVLHNMPKWIPGKHRNQPVRVKCYLPVKFKNKKRLFF